MSEKKERDQMMERPSKEAKEEAGARLKQQYKDLKQEWDNIKQSTYKPRALPRSRSLSESRTMDKAFQEILDNSPRDLMSSLQQDGGWKVRNNDLVVEEILKERKAAIESGKLKGRRLFEEVVGDFSDIEELGCGGREEIVCNGLDGLVQESSEVRSCSSYEYNDEKLENVGDVQIKEKVSPSSHVCCYCHSCCVMGSLSSSSTSSFVCDECLERKLDVKDHEGEKMGAVESMQGAEIDRIGYGNRRMVLTTRLLVCLLVGATSVIFYKRSFSGHSDGDELFLVPT